MACCGRAKKGLHIIQAKTFAAVEKHTGIEILKYERTDERVEICRGCDDNTWMTKAEHYKWLASHGFEVVKNIEDLTALPMLPKYPLDKKRRTIFCRFCKCNIPQKARDKDEKCPKGKWEILNDGN